MFFTFRRKETPWEVVDSKIIDPVSMYDDDDDFDIEVIGEADTRGTYVFDVKQLKRTSNDLRNVVAFAQQQLFEEITRKGYNLLLLESWEITVYRRAKKYRIEVRYNGRPARVNGKVPPRRPPPFMALLQACQ